MAKNLSNMSEFEKDTINYAKKIAISSFIIGSSIFLSFLFLSIESLAYLGVLFLLLAFIANATILLQLFYIRFWQKSKNIDVRNVIILVLANIPIALIYIKIGANLFRDRFGI